ncbi:hypothetical protein BD779DRAFT_1551114, partial [Infundibulicybe gibba]
QLVFEPFIFVLERRLLSSPIPPGAPVSRASSQAHPGARNLSALAHIQAVEFSGAWNPPPLPSLLCTRSASPFRHQRVLELF